MKEIKIRCLNMYNYKIEILKNKRIVSKGSVIGNEYYCFKGKINCVYIVKVYNDSYYYCMPIIILKNGFSIYSFSIPVYTLNRIITIYLQDKYYNLQVERGEIYLWQNHIQ